jgi:hypothetical protein
MPAQEYPEKRRTSRLHFKARVILSGKDADGFSFAEETETVSVSKHGAAMRTSYHLALDQEVSVRTKDNDRVGQFQVVWIGKEGTPQEGLLGVEWLDARRFWGVEFPPEDWQGE